MTQPIPAEEMVERTERYFDMLRERSFLQKVVAGCAYRSDVSQEKLLSFQKALVSVDEVLIVEGTALGLINVQ